jgi:hypothetical protein
MTRGAFVPDTVIGPEASRPPALAPEEIAPPDRRYSGPDAEEGRSSPVLCPHCGEVSRRSSPPRPEPLSSPNSPTAAGGNLSDSFSLPVLTVKAPRPLTTAQRRRAAAHAPFHCPLGSCLACGRHPSTHAPAGLDTDDACPMCGLGDAYPTDCMACAIADETTGPCPVHGLCSVCRLARPPFVAGRCAECRAEASAP